MQPQLYHAAGGGCSSFSPCKRTYIGLVMVYEASFMLEQLICMDTTPKTLSLDSKESHQSIFHLMMKRLFIMGPMPLGFQDK